MAIRGNLKEASLPDVLQLLAMGKKTGCLSITHRASFGYIYFDKGRICYASVVNRRDRLGDMLVKAGVLTQAQLDAALDAQAKRHDTPLGRLLVEHGAVTAEQLHQAVDVQIREAVYFLFTWHHGTFNFESEVAPEGQDQLVSINPESLLLEGARRVDEWSLVEKKIPTFDLIFAADHNRILKSDAELTDEQTCVLEQIDGMRDVQGIIDATVSNTSHAASSKRRRRIDPGRPEEQTRAVLWRRVAPRGKRGSCGGNGAVSSSTRANAQRPTTRERFAGSNDSIHLPGLDATT